MGGHEARSTRRRFPPSRAGRRRIAPPGPDHRDPRRRSSAPSSSTVARVARRELAVASTRSAPGRLAGRDARTLRRGASSTVGAAAVASTSRLRYRTRQAVAVDHRGVGRRRRHDGRTSLTTRRLRPRPGPTAIAAKRSTSPTTSSAHPMPGNGTFTASTGPHDVVGLVHSRRRQPHVARTAAQAAPRDSDGAPVMPATRRSPTRRGATCGSSTRRSGIQAAASASSTRCARAAEHVEADVGDHHLAAVSGPLAEQEPGLECGEGDRPDRPRRPTRRDAGASVETGWDVDREDRRATGIGSDVVPVESGPVRRVDDQVGRGEDLGRAAAHRTRGPRRPAGAGPRRRPVRRCRCFPCRRRRRPAARRSRPSGPPPRGRPRPRPGRSGPRPAPARRDRSRPSPRGSRPGSRSHSPRKGRPAPRCRTAARMRRGPLRDASDGVGQRGRMGQRDPPRPDRAVGGRGRRPTRERHVGLTASAG